MKKKRFFGLNFFLHIPTYDTKQNILQKGEFLQKEVKIWKAVNCSIQQIFKKTKEI